MTSIYLINRTPSTVLSRVTPYERLRSCAPSYGHLRTFGCVCFVFLPSIERSKLSPRSAMCIFHGYSPEHKGYHCYDPTSRHLRTSRYVTFLEDTPFFFVSLDLSFLQRPNSSIIPAPVTPSIVFRVHPLVLLLSLSRYLLWSPLSLSPSPSRRAPSLMMLQVILPCSPQPLPLLWMFLLLCLAAIQIGTVAPLIGLRFPLLTHIPPSFQSFLAAVHAHQEPRSYHEAVQHSH